MKKSFCKLRICLCWLGIFAVSVFLLSCANQAEKAIQEFYRSDGPEETLMDPLILAGDKVVPLVIELVKDKNMPKRRYAIGFLGNGGYIKAVPVLEELLNNQTEETVVRSDALAAIYQLDAPLAMKYAEQYKDDQSNLGEVSNSVISGKEFLPPKRSYFQALAGKLNH